MMRALAILFGALVCVGCGDDYAETDISEVVSSYSGATANPADTIDTHHITISEGHVVKAHIEVKDDDHKNMSVLLKPVDPTIMDVRYVVSPNDFAFYANGVGATAIQIFADDTLVLTINATVVPQPSSE